MKKNNFIGKVFVTNSSKETQKLGRDFGKVLEKGDIVCLYGDLGSGKTTFVQGMAEGLGVKQKIISPTFIIVRNYRIKNYETHSSDSTSSLQASSGQARIMNFYHVDLYRIESKKDLESLGIEEILDDSSNIVVIEWAEKLKGFLPERRIDIKFSYEKDNIRKVAFSLTV